MEALQTGSRGVTVMGSKPAPSTLPQRCLKCGMTQAVMATLMRAMEHHLHCHHLSKILPLQALLLNNKDSGERHRYAPKSWYKLLLASNHQSLTASMDMQRVHDMFMDGAELQEPRKSSGVPTMGRDAPPSCGPFSPGRDPFIPKKFSG